MWSVTNYTLKEENNFSNNLVVRIENEDDEKIIKSVELFVNPSRLRDLIPFSDPIDKIEEKLGSIAEMRHSTIMLAIKLRNKQNVSYVYDILFKMNDDYVNKCKEKTKEVYKDTWFNITDYIVSTSILPDLNIESDIYVKGLYYNRHIDYNRYKKVQLTFEELAKHNLIDRELFMQVYEDFSKKINQCL